MLTDDSADAPRARPSAARPHSSQKRRGRGAGEGWVPKREAALEPRAARRGAGESSSSSPTSSSALSLSLKAAAQSQFTAISEISTVIIILCTTVANSGPVLLYKTGVELSTYCKLRTVKGGANNDENAFLDKSTR